MHKHYHLQSLCDSERNNSCSPNTFQSFVWDTHSGSILGTMHFSLHTILPCTSVSTPYCHAPQSPHHTAMHLSLHTILPCTSVSTPYCHALQSPHHTAMHFSLHTILPCTSVSTPYCHALQSPHDTAMHFSLHTIMPCTSVSTPYCHAHKLKWVCIISVPFVHISPKAVLHMLVHSLVFFI